MTQRNRSTLKGYFETGDVPTEAQFADLIDSFHNPSDDGGAAITDYTVTEGDVTAHEAALTITESQISDLGNYLTAVAWGDVTGKPSFATVATSGAYSDLTGRPSIFDGAYSSLTGIPATFAPSAHTHAASAVTSGTFDNARISEASVTQHADALTITESQVSDLGDYVESDPAGVTGADAITNMMSLTQAEYNAITPNASTFYLITDA